MTCLHLVTAIALSGLCLTASATASGAQNPPPGEPTFAQLSKHDIDVPLRDLFDGHHDRSGPRTDLLGLFGGHHDKPGWTLPNQSCIPEPGTVGMLALGLFGIGFVRARSTRQR